MDVIEFIENMERNSIRSEAAANWALQQPAPAIPRNWLPTAAELARAAARRK
jgi:hypothetical protein